MNGNAYGLEEGASVEIVVTPLGDLDYVQDGRGLIKKGASSSYAVWTVPSCLFGRAGRDSGQQFYVKARARSASRLVESRTITVTRE